jgi:hypothetical protein
VSPSFTYNNKTPDVELNQKSPAIGEEGAVIPYVKLEPPLPLAVDAIVRVFPDCDIVMFDPADNPTKPVIPL